MPGSPVPVSGQSLTVLAGSAALGPARAVTASLAHGLLAGSGVAGFAPVRPETAGYVAGFLVAGPVVACLVSQGRADRPGGAFGVASLGHALIVVAGAAHLQRCAPGRVLRRGVLPFMAGGALKSAALAGLGPLAARLRRSSTAAAASGRDGRIRTGDPLLPKQVR